MVIVLNTTDFHQYCSYIVAVSFIGEGTGVPGEDH
jgi:hypothetical protein